MSQLPKLAVLADFPQEKWPSMDLAAEMLLKHLQGSDFVRAKQDVVQWAIARAGERDEFQVRPGRREDDRDIVGNPIGGADALPQRLQPRRIILPAERADMRESVRGDVVGGGRCIGQHVLRPRRGIIAVPVVFGIEDDAGIAARGHQVGGTGLIGRQLGKAHDRAI